MMTKDEIYEFLNTHTVASLATINDNRPAVRKVWTVKSDADGIMFHTSSAKPLFSQLQTNNNAEFCFCNEDNSIQIRVYGKAEQLHDDEVKKELAKERTFLQDIAAKTGSYDFLSVFLLKNCVANVWTFETNMAPKEFIEL